MEKKDIFFLRCETFEILSNKKQPFDRQTLLRHHLNTMTLNTKTQLPKPLAERLRKVADKTGLKMTDLVRIGAQRLCDDVEKRGVLNFPLSQTETEAANG